MVAPDSRFLEHGGNGRTSILEHSCAADLAGNTFTAGHCDQSRAIAVVSIAIVAPGGDTGHRSQGQRCCFRLGGNVSQR
jgi:hypothetical protein